LFNKQSLFDSSIGCLKLSEEITSSVTCGFILSQSTAVHDQNRNETNEKDCLAHGFSFVDCRVDLFTENLNINAKKANAIAGNKRNKRVRPR
jgi:hypothetical protein